MARCGVLTYHSPEEMQEAIDKYFEDCEGQILLDKNGNPMLDKNDQPVYINRKPLTVTGLALALGFSSRISLLDYQAKSKKYNEIITKAKLKIENYAEMRLFDRDGNNGAKFNLQNNFKKWDADKVKDEDNKPTVNIICDIPKSDNAKELPNVAMMSVDPQAISEAQEQLKEQNEQSE